jgi:4a-hydroxytetrahydrobiopterin dehydratase
MERKEEQDKLSEAMGPLTRETAEKLAHGVPEWSLKDRGIEREFLFKDFRGAMTFVNGVADIAEGEAHHPDIFISYGRVRLTLSTHRIGGLSRNDFIVAAKIDEMAKHLKPNNSE